jgi:hypothetical protein
MPGTPCKSDLAHSSMTSLKQFLNKWFDLSQFN